jgi:hypothetical protein
MTSFSSNEYSQYGALNGYSLRAGASASASAGASTSSRRGRSTQGDYHYPLAPPARHTSFMERVSTTASKYGNSTQNFARVQWNGFTVSAINLKNNIKANPEVFAAAIAFYAVVYFAVSFKPVLIGAFVFSATSLINLTYNKTNNDEKKITFVLNKILGETLVVKTLVHLVLFPINKELLVFQAITAGCALLTSRNAYKSLRA